MIVVDLLRRGAPAGDAPGSPGLDVLRHDPRLAPRLGLTVALVVGAFLRLWQIGSLGLNSDETVYAGQAASIAGNPAYTDYFPIFRAHPLLFQSLLSVYYQWSDSDMAGRVLSAAFGVATIFATYKVGAALYDRRVGAIAALVLAVMPYHVVVTRQILLDGAMVFFATTGLYFLARYCGERLDRYALACAAAMGLAFLTKETAVVLWGGVYLFFMLSRTMSIRLPTVFGMAVVFSGLALAFWLALRLSGAARTGDNYVVWQLFRRPNHTLAFYAQTVPVSIGLVVVAVAAAGLIGRRLAWQEGLLLAWAVVPLAFFELMPVKGFQYLLPVAPVAAVLAGRSVMLVFRSQRVASWTRGRGRLAAAGLLALMLTAQSVAVWPVVSPTASATFLAGAGGLPAGREAGTWVGRNLPRGSVLLTLGPSMANVIEFYGHRQAYGLSVSPNPLNRNPAYVPVENVDRELRQGNLQYVVWDSFSAERSPSFSAKLLGYVHKYRGIAIHTESVAVTADDGSVTLRPAVTVYEVQP